MNRNMLNTAIAVALLGSVALVGCKKKEESAAAPAPGIVEPAPAPAVAPPAPPPPVVIGVDLGSMIGSDNKIASPATTFAKQDTIHASVATDGGTPAKLAAKWSFQDGQVVHSEDREVPAGRQTTEFKISKPGGWPAGKYKLEVSLDGSVVQSKDFEVK